MVALLFNGKGRDPSLFIYFHLLHVGKTPRNTQVPIQWVSVGGKVRPFSVYGVEGE